MAITRGTRYKPNRSPAVLTFPSC